MRTIKNADFKKQILQENYADSCTKEDPINEYFTRDFESGPGSYRWLFDDETVEDFGCNLTEDEKELANEFIASLSYEEKDDCEDEFTQFYDSVEGWCSFESECVENPEQAEMLLKEEGIKVEVVQYEDEDEQGEQEQYIAYCDEDTLREVFARIQEKYENGEY